MQMHEYIPKKDKADLKEYKIERDLNQRKARNQKQLKLERAFERFVLDLGPGLGCISLHPVGSI